eukprot:9129787-Alexandrium_andersonii.AAC.1
MRVLVCARVPIEEYSRAVRGQLGRPLEATWKHMRAVRGQMESMSGCQCIVEGRQRPSQFKERAQGRQRPVEYP